MFTRDERKPTLKPTKSLKDLSSMEPVEQLFDDKKRQTLLSHIKESIGMTQAGFEKLAAPVLHQLGRYCQRLPETSMYYAHQGGLIDRCLNRTEAALELTRHILVLEKNETPSEEQKLWLYALFSASMLRGIGKLYTDYQIDLFDANAHYIKRWQPLFEDLLSAGKYYHYEWLRANDIAFRNHVTLCLAKQMMPNAGFTQLSTNPEVFAVWLMLLQEGLDATEPLAAILDRANAIAIQRDIHEYLLKFAEWNEGRGNRIGSFIDKTADVTVDKERLIGAEFITWLTHGFESGKILINQHAHIAPTGIILSTEIFDMFVQDHQKIKNRVAVQQAFLSWKLHLSNKGIQETAQNSKQIQVDTTVLPEKVKIYDTQSHKTTTVNTLNLINNLAQFSKQKNATIPPALQHLSANGKWVPAGDDLSPAHHATIKRF